MTWMDVFGLMVLFGALGIYVGLLHIVGEWLQRRHQEGKQ